MSLEQGVQLSVGSSLGFRKAEISPCEAQETESSPEEACLAFPVPGGRIQHVWSNDSIDYTHDIVEIASKHDGFGLEASGGDFGDETVADGSNGQVVSEGIDE